MKKYIRTISILFAFTGVVIGLYVSLFGDLTPAPYGGSMTFSKGVNLNRTNNIIQSVNGDIYTIGPTCVQKFDSNGNFIKGVYFGKNMIKRFSNSEFLSLNEDKIAVLDCGADKIIIFDKEFNLVETIPVPDNYGYKKFYTDYPCSETNSKKIELTPFNTIIIEDRRIKLDAPRNLLLSSTTGSIILLLSVLALFFIFENK